MLPLAVPSIASCESSSIGMQASAATPFVKPMKADTPESRSCRAFAMHLTRAPPSSSVTSSKRTPVEASSALAAAKAAAIPFWTSRPYTPWMPVRAADCPNRITRGFDELARARGGIRVPARDPEASSNVRRFILISHTPRGVVGLLSSAWMLYELAKVSGPYAKSNRLQSHLSRRRAATCLAWVRIECRSLNGLRVTRSCPSNCPRGQSTPPRRARPTWRASRTGVLPAAIAMEDDAGLRLALKP